MMRRKGSSSGVSVCARTCPATRGECRLPAPGAASRFAREERKLPALRLMVMAQDVLCAVVSADLEVAVVGAKPPIDDFGHFDAARAEREAARCLLTAVAGIAFDAQVHRAPMLRRMTGIESSNPASE